MSSLPTMPKDEVTASQMEEDNDNFCTTKASLLNLPPEIRAMIYSYFTPYIGTITIYTNYSFSKDIDSQSLILLHVNRLIRSEIEDFFYANQEFSFRSVTAAQKFIEGIGDRRAALIRKIQFESWFTDRFASILGHGFMSTLQKLRNVERVVFREPRMKIASDPKKRQRVMEEGREFLITIPRPHPPRSYIFDWYDMDYELGPSSYIVMATWPQFTDGNVTFYKFTRHHQFWDERTNALFFTVPGEIQAEDVVPSDLYEPYEPWWTPIPYPVPLSDQQTLRLHAAKYATDADWIEAAQAKARFRKVQNEKARERAKVRAKEQERFKLSLLSRPRRSKRIERLLKH